MREKIIAKIEATLTPNYLELIDDSKSHAGHKGNTLSAESHFILKISSEKLHGISRVEAHKMIYTILKDEMRAIHALNIHII